MSIREIAKQAGVSIASVSRVLNNHPKVSIELRERVLNAANQTGYTEAKERTACTNIAFLYTADTSLGSPFDAALLQGLSQSVAAVGYDLLILDAHRTKRPGESYTQLFARKGIAGAVIRTTTERHAVCLDIIAEELPAVVVGERFDEMNVSYVYSDSRQSTREAIEHLLSMGHERVAICTNVVDDSDHRDRIGAYQEALNDRDIEVDPKLMMRFPANREGGVQAMRRLMSLRDRPTALFLTDPMAAVGAVNEAQVIGLNIPEDLSIIGFDDSESRLMVFPQLTAVCQDATEIGRAAFEIINEIIDGKDEVIRRALPTWFEIHESTGPVRNNSGEGGGA